MKLTYVTAVFNAISKKFIYDYSEGSQRRVVITRSISDLPAHRS